MLDQRYLINCSQILDSHWHKSSTICQEGVGVWTSASSKPSRSKFGAGICWCWRGCMPADSWLLRVLTQQSRWRPTEPTRRPPVANKMPLLPIKSMHRQLLRRPCTLWQVCRLQSKPANCCHLHWHPWHPIVCNQSQSLEGRPCGQCKSTGD